MPGEPSTSRVVRDVLVPRSLLSWPEAFGGTEVQDCLRGDLVIEEDMSLRLKVSASGVYPRGLVMPKLCEPHVHLDKCHTISRIGATGGSLQDAIAAQSEDKGNWSAEDIRTRAGRGLRELAASGCGAVRSHVDWPHEESAKSPPTAWSVLRELAQEVAPEVALQLSPLLGVNDYAVPGVADAMGKLLGGTDHALGCFVYDQPDRKEGIMAAFRTADRYGLALDFHVDEGLEKGLDGLALIAEAAIETGFKGPILCGHACSLMNLTGDALARRIERVAKAGITVVALPSTNFYLQGRNGGTPDRLGITRVHELLAGGVDVIIGTDNVQDAFCPLNRHDPRLSLSLAALGVHLDPLYGLHLPMITTRAEAALGRTPRRIDDTPPDDLLIYQATSTADFLCSTASPEPLFAAIESRNP
ncbi:MAG: amidohydrolase family protein [Sulfitobacter sp.]|nr:amidohydrolase family protein [Sulfitobacter sp.]